MSLVQAVAALLIVATAQFQTVTFDAGPTYLSMGSGTHHPFGSAIGHPCRVKCPDDWSDDEAYDLDWSKLKDEPVRFRKIDFRGIPS